MNTPDDASPEYRQAILAGVYFFCLLSGYYLLRPVRDEFGVRAGVDQLQWLFTATFVAMLAAVPLYGWASRQLSRRHLITAVYLVFVFSLLLFYAGLLTAPDNIWLARGFYVWVSVYNLFVVSVFWSYMADVFSREQGRRLFGRIAAGGSFGALLGPGLAAWGAQWVGVAALLPIAAGLLVVATLCAWLIGRGSPDRGAPALGGGVWEGVGQVLGSRQLQGIALFIWLYTTLATFLYFQQAHIVAGAFGNSADRTSVFALIDLAVNSLTLVLQFFVTGRLMQAWGLHRTLAVVPATLAVGLVVLASAPVIWVLAAVQTVRRAGNYGLTRPAREVLYTGVDRSARYKAKNFIDTVVYRGGDALAGWLFAALKSLGLGIGATAWVAVPLALAWGWLGYRLGWQFEQTDPAGKMHRQEGA